MTLMLIVTMISIGLALIATLVAWRLFRDERRRADARVAALAADIHGARSKAPYADVSLNEVSPVAVDHLFTDSDRDATSVRRRVVAILGGGALVVASAAALMVFVTSGAHPAASAGQATRAARTTNTPAAPLELVALGHEREDDRLTVHGVIRNPASGTAVVHLTAVVLLFNKQGGFVTSGRAAVNAVTLAPGDDAPFVVTVPGAADVSRYRVSFRAEDRVMPHVDRRS
ncbi:MAG: hypothetical protein V7647_1191 [Acidobacteriota bacterium]